jgi:hypothetical protein
MNPAPLELAVSYLIPFWTSPSLFALSIGQFGLHIAGDDNGNTHKGDHDRYDPGQLAEVEHLTISCSTDAGAIKELLAFRKARSFSYVSSHTPNANYDFNSYTAYLAPSVQTLSYIWREDISTPWSRYPDLSELSNVTTVELEAQSLADLSNDEPINQQPEMLCKLPVSLELLNIRVDTERTSRRKFYGLIADFVGITSAIPNLKTIQLDFGFAEVQPSENYWNNRLISEWERTTCELQEADLYEANGQTVEHNSLRRACERANMKLHSEYRLMYPERDGKAVRD